MLSIREPHPEEIVAIRPPDVLARELARIGATRAELRAAHAFNARDAGFDPRAYDKLSSRMRRLVDLLAVADPCVEAMSPCGGAMSSDTIRIDAAR